MLVISQGRVIDPARNLDEQADVVVDGSRITKIGPRAGADLRGEQIITIDAKGRWVVPGLIDLHVHFREPGQEYKETIETGLRAAAAGGFTAVCTMPNTRPVNDTRAVTEMILARARQCGGPRLYPIAAITVGQKGDQLTEMADLCDAGAVGVSDDGQCVMDTAVMRRAMEYARTFDILVTQHCEDKNLSHGTQMHEGVISTRLGLEGCPREAEDVIVARDLLLAEMTGARYHIAHISSINAVRLLREAKSRGAKVTAEVTPHHLMLTDEALLEYDSVYKVNPPLREKKDRDALREALRDGTVDCIATDHAPHTELEKECEFAQAACGMVGLEQAVPVLLELVRDQILTPMRFIEALSTTPARIARLPGGSLREGQPADLTIIDPEHHWTMDAKWLHSRSKNTPFLGKKVQGAIMLTIVDGQIAYQRNT
ncbi:MAG: dihydroorotase [Deltaproteobacteria bacterium]|nr:dihydroorotase [Deltaproteobacteria bacterium]